VIRSERRCPALGPYRRWHEVEATSPPLPLFRVSCNEDFTKRVSVILGSKLIEGETRGLNPTALVPVQRPLDRVTPLRRTRRSQSAAATMRRTQVEDSGTCDASTGAGAGTAISAEAAVFVGSKLTCTGESRFMTCVDPFRRRPSLFRICRRNSNSSSRRFGRSATGSRQSRPISHLLCATGSPPAKQPCEVFCPT